MVKHLLKIGTPIIMLIALVLGRVVGLSAASKVQVAKALPQYVEKRLDADVLQRDYNDGRKSLVVGGREFPNVAPPLPKRDISIRESDRKRGYITFVRAGRVGILPWDKPAEAERTDRIAVFACTEEYEPATFGIYALKNLGKVKISCSPLISERGRVIAPGAISVSKVETVAHRKGLFSQVYEDVPWLLRPTSEFEVRSNTVQQVWLSINVPRDAATGRYSSTVTIVPQNGMPSKMKLILDVLPFTLEKPIPWGLYYYGSPISGTTAKSMTADFRLMRKLGLTTAALCPWNGTLGVKKAETGEIQLDFSFYDELMEAYKKAGFPEPPVIGINNLPTFIIAAMGREADFPDVEDDYGFGARRFKDEGFPQDIAAEIKKALRAIYDHALEKFWPPFYIYLVDEPIEGSWKGEQAKLLYRLSKEAAIEMKTACTLYTPGWTRPVDKWVNLRIAHSVHPLNNDIANAEWRKMTMQHNSKNELYGIEWFMGEADFWSVRRLTLMAEKGLDGMMCWEWNVPDIELFDRDPYITLRGAAKADPLLFKGKSIKGEIVIMTMSAEALREGIDDSRYVRTLDHLIQQLGYEGIATGTCEKARMWLRDQMETIPWTQEARAYPERWTSADADRFRKGVKDWIIRLLNERAEIRVKNTAKMEG